MFKEKIKALIKSHIGLTVFLIKIINNLPFNNLIRIPSGNKFSCRGLLYNAHIKVVGKNNIILIGNLCRMRNLRIAVNGNNNYICIKDGAYAEDCEIVVEDNSNIVSIGEKTIISGKTHLAAIERTSITIGEDCLFSADITIRTGDSHSILLADSGKRINPSEDVTISDSVWIGNGATILKGVTIQSHSVIGTQAVVTKSPDEGYCILAGNPAKVVKSHIDWQAKRIEI